MNYFNVMYLIKVYPQYIIECFTLPAIINQCILCEIEQKQENSDIMNCAVLKAQTDFQTEFPSNGMMCM